MKIPWLLLTAALLWSGVVFVKSEGWMTVTVVRNLGLQLSVMGSVGLPYLVSAGGSVSFPNEVPPEPPVIVVSKDSTNSKGVVLDCAFDFKVGDFYILCERIWWSRHPPDNNDDDDGDDDDEGDESAVIIRNEEEGEEKEEEEEDADDDGGVKNETSHGSSGMRINRKKGKAQALDKRYRIYTDRSIPSARLYLPGTGEAFRGRYSCTMDFYGHKLTADCLVTESLLRSDLNAGKLCSGKEEGPNNSVARVQTFLLTVIITAACMLIVVALRWCTKYPHRFRPDALYQVRVLERQEDRLGSQSGGGGGSGSGQHQRYLCQIRRCRRGGWLDLLKMPNPWRNVRERLCGSSHAGGRAIGSSRRRSRSTTTTSSRGRSTTTSTQTSKRVRSSMEGLGQLMGLPSYQDTVSPRQQERPKRGGQAEALLVHKVAAEQDQHDRVVSEALQAPVVFPDSQSAQPPPYESPAAPKRLVSSSRSFLDLSFEDAHSTSPPPSYRSTHTGALREASVASSSGSPGSDSESPQQDSNGQVEPEMTHQSGNEPGSPCATASQQVPAEEPDRRVDPPEERDRLRRVVRWLLGTPPPAYVSVVLESEPV